MFAIVKMLTQITKSPTAGNAGLPVFFFVSIIFFSNSISVTTNKKEYLTPGSTSIQAVVVKFFPIRT